MRQHVLFDYNFNRNTDNILFEPSPLSFHLLSERSPALLEIKKTFETDVESFFHGEYTREEWWRAGKAVNVGDTVR